MIEELRQYQPAEVADDAPPLDRAALVRACEGYMEMRLIAAETYLDAGEIEKAAAQIAMGHLYLGLIEQIREGKFDR